MKDESVDQRVRVKRIPVIPSTIQICDESLCDQVRLTQFTNDDGNVNVKSTLTAGIIHANASKTQAC